VEGSPFGAGYGTASVATDPTGQFAYVVNASSDNIWAYSIDPGSGALATISGSPFYGGQFPHSIALATVGGPVLGIALSHAGDFAQGQTAATYQAEVSNNGTASTSGMVLVAERLPARFTLVSMVGTGWTCPNGGVTCFRSDTLPGGASYPPITVTVNVAETAAPSVVNQASVSGSGSPEALANDTTIVLQPILSITSTHTAAFAEGQNGAAYTLTVSNSPQAAATFGVVYVTETVPNGLTLVSMAGTGWLCNDQGFWACSRSDALIAGASYPPVTVTMNVAPNAPAAVTNYASVSGGGSAAALGGDPTSITLLPVLRVGSTHTGNFTQGESSATYSLLVENLGGLATAGTVTVVENTPSGLTLVSMGGIGWTCPNNGDACTRSDALAAGASYAPITVTVNVVATAPLTVVNQVSVSGGGSVAASGTDPTTAIPLPVLSIAKSHSGNFLQGQSGAIYTVTVSASAAGSASSGTATVSESLPAGLTLVSLGGSGWTCPIGGVVCMRDDSLAAGASYPPITVIVNVGAAAPASLVNQVSVAGGGAAVTAAASDLTAVFTRCDVNQYGSTTVADVQSILNQAIGGTTAVNDLNHDGLVNVVDVRIAIDAALGWGCPAS